MKTTAVEKLIVFAIAIGVGLTFSFIALRAMKVPLSQPSALIKTQDVCACGGNTVFLGSQWIEGRWYCYYGNNGYVTVKPC